MGKDIIKNIPKVSNFTGAVNQFEIIGKDFTLFQSYNSSIALKQNGKTYIFRDWDCSKTTGKYRNLFLGESKTETLKKLKNKTYIAVDFEV